jgi:hypothetical protein
MKRFARFVEFDTTDEDWASEGDEIFDMPLPEKRVSDLVEEFLADENLRQAHRNEVFSSSGRRTHIFGRILAAKSTPAQREKFFNHFVELGEKASLGILSSFLLETKSIDTAEWMSFVKRLLSDDRPATWRVEAVMSSGFSASVVDVLVRFVREFDDDLHIFKQLGYGFAQKHLSPNDIERILDAMMKNPSKIAPDCAMEIASYWFGGEKKNVLPEPLHFKLLFNKRLLRSKRWNTMKSHHWGELAKSFRRNYPSRDLDIVRNALRVRDAIGRIDTMSSLFELVSDMCALHPKNAWPIVSKALRDEASSDALRYWLGGDGEIGLRQTNNGAVSPPIAAFDYGDIFAWVDKDIKARAPIIADCLPRTFDGRAGELTLSFVKRYAARETVGDSLIFRFQMGTRSGPATEWLSAQREEALSASSKTNSAAVRKWLEKYVAYLSRDIERQRINEERRI